MKRRVFCSLSVKRCVFPSLYLKRCVLHSLLFDAECLILSFWFSAGIPQLQENAPPIDICLVKGTRVGCFLMSEVPLYCAIKTSRQKEIQGYLAHER